MKKKFLLLLFLLIIPININASISVKYDDAVSFQEKYITKFNLYQKNLLTGSSVEFGYKANNSFNDSSFTYAGLLNKDEYQVSGDKSYLYDGQEYYTMTKEGTKVYVLTNDGMKLVDTSSLYSVRYTGFVKKYTKVTGTGTYVDPWLIEAVKDFEPPVISAMPENSSNTKVANVKISATDIGDTGLGDNDYSYYVSNSDSALEGGGWIKYDNNATISFGTSFTGTKYLFIKQISDVVENYSIQKGILKTISGEKYHVFGPYVLDNTNPSCSIVKNPTGWTRSVKLIISPSDNSSQFDANPYSWTNESSGYSSSNEKDVIENKEYTAWIKDKAGNVSSCKTSVTNIDRTSPVISAVTPTNGIRKITLSVSASDTQSGVKYYYYKYNGQAAYTKTTSSTHTFDVDNGTYIMYSYVEDNAGNVSAEKSAQVKAGYDCEALAISGTYNVGAVLSYGGLSWKVMSNSSDRVNLILNGNYTTGVFGSNATWSTSTIRSTLNNTFANAYPVIQKAIANGCIAADSEAGSYVRLPKYAEISTTIANPSGTPFWTMTAVSASALYVSRSNGQVGSSWFVNTGNKLYGDWSWCYPPYESYLGSAGTPCNGFYSCDTIFRGYQANNLGAGVPANYSQIVQDVSSGYYSNSCIQTARFPAQPYYWSWCTGSGTQTIYTGGGYHTYASPNDCNIKYLSGTVLNIGIRPVITLMKQ